MTHLFCDSDGVLVDMELGFRNIFGFGLDDVPEPQMWDLITNHKGFWEHLPAMPGALMLWARIAQYAPTILTGCPRGGYNKAEIGKRAWYARETGLHVPVITCFSRNKPQHMKNKGDVLIDDLIKNCNRWTEAGGVAIHHTSAEDTIRQLEQLGF